MRISTTPDQPLRQYREHPRDWRENVYVYPVISRRSGGLSIGVNLNPDAACNFDCAYCQVDRSGEPGVNKVDLDRLRAELSRMIKHVQGGVLWRDPAFADVPLKQRVVRDIAFSGDGEPTTCRHFLEAVGLVAVLRRGAGWGDTKIVLITNASGLAKPEVATALAIMDENNGEIWAKLDAGTEAYSRKVNRSNFPLQQVIDNIIAAARVRPVVIQSLFMRLEGEGPEAAELTAFVDRLREITRSGGRIDYVQVYTVARRPAEEYVSALDNAEVDHIVDLVRQAGFRAEAYYGLQS